MWYIDSNASLTIWCLFVERFVFGLKIHFSFWYHFIGVKTFSLEHSFEVCKQTISCREGPDLENRVGYESIRRAIQVVLPSLWSTCDMVYGLNERAQFSCSFLAVLGRFLPSNVPIILHNIHHWWFFIFKGNWWTKYTTTFKVSMPPLNHCFWWSRVWITLIKPLLCLNRIFSHQKAIFHQHTKIRCFHCLKICNSSFT